MSNVKRCKHCKRTGLQLAMKRAQLKKLADGTYICQPFCPLYWQAYRAEQRA